jgi:predicted HNH restriction endonuclease
MNDNLKRYKAAKAALLAERGHVCEACGAPASHPHHVAPCSETGIASELVFDPANMIVLCDSCHAMMHPGHRRYWTTGTRASRGRDLQGKSRKK